MIAKEPDNAYFQELKGQMLYEFGRGKEAIRYYEKATTQLPDKGLIRMAYAECLIESAGKDPKTLGSAIDQLKRAERDEPRTSKIKRLLATAYGKMGKEMEARVFLAESFDAREKRRGAPHGRRPRETPPQRKQRSPQGRRHYKCGWRERKNALDCRFGFLIRIRKLKEKNIVTPFKASLMSAAAIALLLSPVSSKAEDAKSAPFTEEQKGALEDFVRDFIMNDPEVLVESVNQMHAKEAQKQEEAAATALKANSDFFYKNDKLPFVGNAKGDITVVEFFDYNCGYCKRALDAVKKTIEDDKNVRVVFVDLPILSPQSETAAKWALAANKQGKYWEFHKAIMESNAPKSDDNLADIAKSAGLDVKKLKADAAGKDIEEELAANHTNAAQKLQISGTPAFIVGDQIIRGFVEYDGFKAIIADERKKLKN